MNVIRAGIQAYKMVGRFLQMDRDEPDRDRTRVPLKKALKLISNDGLRQVMKKLPETI